MIEKENSEKPIFLNKKVKYVTGLSDIQGKNIFKNYVTS